MLIFIIIFIKLYYISIYCDLISSSNIQKCINDGSSSLTCINKLIVTLTVHNSQNNTESLQFNLNEITDLDGTRKTLQSPYTLTLTKTPVYIRYPLTYSRSYNNKPYEQIMQLGPGFNGFFDPCEDRAGAGSSTTCPPAYDSLQGKVVDSQGFCCYCSFNQLIGLDKYTGSRGQLSCELFGSQTASASCLSMDPLWYYGYTIGPSSTYFIIDITLTKNVGLNTPGGMTSQENEYLWVGPQNLGAASSSGDVIASLQGDLVNYQSTLQLNNKMLLIPSTPGNPKTYEGVGKYMLVDNTLFTNDGSECNKIGVSYSAFRNQVNPCTRQAGTCLANQPDDLYKADSAKLLKGLKGQYFASNYGDMDLLNFGDGSTDVNTHYLSYIQADTTRSLLTLTLSADSIFASGKFLSVTVPTFEAGSKNGQLTVVVLSTGSVNSDFTVSVTECTAGIAPINAKTFTIVAGGDITLKFQIWSEYTLAANHHCLLTLKSSQFAVLQTYVAFFNVTSLVEDRGTQGGDQAPIGSFQFIPYSFDCDRICPGFFNITCFLFNGCWASLSKVIALCIGLCIFLCCFKNIKRMFMCIFEVAGNAAEAMPVSEYEKAKKKSNKNRDNSDDDQIELTDIKRTNCDKENIAKAKKKHSFIFKKVQTKRFR